MAWSKALITLASDFKSQQHVWFFLKAGEMAAREATMADVHPAAALSDPCSCVTVTGAEGPPGHRTRARTFSSTRSPALPLRAPHQSHAAASLLFESRWKNLDHGLFWKISTRPKHSTVTTVSDEFQITIQLQQERAVCMTEKMTELQLNQT